VNIVEAIQLRKSIRGYKPTPVPRDVLREILEIATRSPSADNWQPWEITVVTGEALDKIRQGNVEMLTSGAITDSASAHKKLEGVYRQRQVGVGIQLFKLMDIAREDKQKREQWIQRGFRFFNAPVAIIISADSCLDESHAQFDIGAISQAICLTALNYGLGTCIDLASIEYPEVVRRFTGIPESKRIVISIAIGYPDRDFPANKVESERECLENIVTWCGFD